MCVTLTHAQLSESKTHTFANAAYKEKIQKCIPTLRIQLNW